MTIEVATAARVLDLFVLLVAVRSYHDSSFEEPHSTTKDEILEVVVLDFQVPRYIKMRKETLGKTKV
jgi:hypothetical protein